MNLELGGKTPMVVFDDADLDSVVPLLAAGITTFSGQFFVTGSRILVQRGRGRRSPQHVCRTCWKTFGSATEWTRTPTWVPSSTSRTSPGSTEWSRQPSPTPSRSSGVVLPLTPLSPPARFYRPSLLEVDDVTSDIVQKEVFAPVATFEVFDTEDDAIARANAGEMGLAAGVFTNNLNISNRVSRAHQGRHGLDEHLGGHQ